MREREREEGGGRERGRVCVRACCMCMCVYVCMGAHACRDQGSTSGVVPHVPRTCFLRQCFSLAWDSPSRLSQLAGESPRSGFSPLP